MKFICLIPFLISLLKSDGSYSTSNPDFIGEQLIFKMEYINLTVATLNFHVIDTTRINHQISYHLKVQAKSTRAAGLLFRLDNIYETYFDVHTFLPIKAVKNIRQKNIQHDLTIQFNHQQHKASIGDSTIWTIPTDCYDYFSMLYYLRNQLLNIGDSLYFHLDSEYLISEVETVVLSDREIIKVPAGTFKALKLKLNFNGITDKPRPWKTDLLTNRLAKPGSELLIWLSDDEYRLPLKISYQQAAIKTHIFLKSFHWGKQN